MSDDKNRGLYRKYIRIERADGGSESGRKHEDCDFFVLDLTCDEFAIPAIEAYALACSGEYPQLSDDLMTKVNQAKLGRRLERLSWGEERNVRSPAPPPYPDVQLK